MKPGCQHFEPLLLDYGYGELDPQALRALEDHLASCEDCSASLEGLVATRRLMSALPDEAPERGDEFILQAAAREVRLRAGATPGWLVRLGRWLVANPLASTAAFGGLAVALLVVTSFTADNIRGLMGASAEALSGDESASAEKHDALSERHRRLSDFGPAPAPVAADPAESLADGLTTEAAREEAVVDRAAPMAKGRTTPSPARRTPPTGRSSEPRPARDEAATSKPDGAVEAGLIPLQTPRGAEAPTTRPEGQVRPAWRARAVTPDRPAEAPLSAPTDAQPSWALSDDEVEAQAETLKRTKADGRDKAADQAETAEQKGAARPPAPPPASAAAPMAAAVQPLEDVPLGGGGLNRKRKVGTAAGKAEEDLDEVHFRESRRAAAGEPERAAARAAAREPERAAAREPERAAAGEPERAAAGEPERAAAREPERAAAREPERDGDRPEATDSGTDLLERGLVLARQNRCVEALDLLDRALRADLAGRRGEAHLARGRCLLSRGREGEARDAFAHAASLAPKTATAREAVLMLDALDEEPAEAAETPQAAPVAEP